MVCRDAVVEGCWLPGAFSRNGGGLRHADAQKDREKRGGASDGPAVAPDSPSHLEEPPFYPPSVCPTLQSAETMRASVRGNVRSGDGGTRRGRSRSIPLIRCSL